jgi:hypothetical protein
MGYVRIKIQFDKTFKRNVRSLVPLFPLFFACIELTSYLPQYGGIDPTQMKFSHKLPIRERFMAISNHHISFCYPAFTTVGKTVSKASSCSRVGRIDVRGSGNEREEVWVMSLTARKECSLHADLCFIATYTTCVHYLCFLTSLFRSRCCILCAEVVR